MFFISHRGNIDKKNVDLENSPDYIINAINLNYDVEVDLWLINDKFFLGHDEPNYQISIHWLIKYKKKLWVHCKDLNSIVFLIQNKVDLNFFWHDTDLVTLTSKKFMWSKQNNSLIENSIVIIPDFYKINYYNYVGVCSDQIKLFKYDYEKTRF